MQTIEVASKSSTRMASIVRTLPATANWHELFVFFVKPLKERKRRQRGCSVVPANKVSQSMVVISAAPSTPQITPRRLLRWFGSSSSITRAINCFIVLAMETNDFILMFASLTKTLWLSAYFNISFSLQCFDILHTDYCTFTWWKTKDKINTWLHCICYDLSQWNSLVRNIFS